MVLLDLSRAVSVESCGDVVFLSAVPEVSLGLVPSSKSLCDFSIGFWITADEESQLQTHSFV